MTDQPVSAAHTPVPDAAYEAAARAAAFFWNASEDERDDETDRSAYRAVGAAAPHIRAAERERIAAKLRGEVDRLNASSDQSDAILGLLHAAHLIESEASHDE